MFSQALTKLQQVLEKQFLLREGLRRTPCPGAFQSSYFSSSTSGIIRGFFPPNYHQKNLGEILEVNLKIVWRYSLILLSLEVLTFIIVHIEPPAICQLQFRFSYFGTGYPRCLCLWISFLVGWDSMYLPIFLSSLGDSGLTYQRASQMDLKSIHF